MKRNVKDREFIKRALSYVKKVWWLYLPTLLFFSAQNVFITLSETSLQKAAIDFFGLGAYDEKIARIVRILLIYLLLLLVVMLFCGLIDYVNLYLTNKIKKDLFQAYLVFRPGSAGTKENTGDMSARLINDCGSIAAFLTYSLGMFFMPVFQAVGCMAALCCYHWLLGAGVLACTVLLLLYNRLIQPKIRKVSSKMQENTGDFMGRLGDSLTMAETIRAYRLEEEEQEKTGAVILRSRRLRKRSMLYTAGRVSVGNICNFLYVGGAIGLGVSLFLKGELPLSVLTIIPTLASGVLRGIEDFCGMTLELQPVLASMERVFTVIDRCPATAADTREIQRNDPAAAAVEIAGVGFAYENGSGISDVSLKVQPDTYLAIRGEIGCGKSTLMKVLLGLQEKNAGTIRVFGRSQDSMPAESWFENFTYVEQNQKLFLGTIEENILLGEERDDERLACVLELTGLGEMVKRFPEGIHTMAESQGDNFSGGERQLICFARALYSHAPIMILDEFSSAFDTVTDGRAIEALKAVTQDAKSAIRKTVLVISHKEDFIKAADRVYVME